MITLEEHNNLVKNTWQKCKEDLTILLESVCPKEESKASYTDRVQAMYENLIAMRNIASIPYSNNNSL